ncbi:MAG: SusD/RagB family nutrient-binding outer membrane lipoprotein [Bacteroidales bacterium]|nr:SusD/RagB family nutrient-binding outer membrane lipoprotein [Bacteroidales bacterium]
MKLFKSMILCGLVIAAMTAASCNEWLDVNTDPENPTLEAASYQLELAHCEFYTNSANQFAAWRTSMAMGDWTRNNGGGNYWNVSYWYPVDGQVTTAYQWFFVGAGPTLKDLYDKAMEAENWHYAGVAQVLLAYGFMLMTDLHGEMPYDDALSENALPVYSTGKRIYEGCFERIDEAIELLQKPIDAGLPALSVGDWWNGGDTQKWLKLAYFLKARWCNKLIKKAPGSYKDGKFDTATILDCLSKAMQSNAESTIINHTDDNGTTHDNLGWDEPVDYSPLYSVCGMNSGYMVTRMLYDNLTNFDGLGVEDPRADHIIPWARSGKSDSTPAEIKWNANGTWRRSLGVDMLSNINNEGGPLRAQWDANKHFYINSNNSLRLGDTVYVECTSESKGYAAKKDLLYRRGGATVDASAESGSFYSRVSAPTYVGTYMEACFIKAEVLFNQGDKNGAYTAYKEGIKSAIELMNDKLKVWVSEDQTLNDCPSFTPMKQADIDNFLANGIGTASDLTLGRILTQKRLALQFSVEIWNDMRRYDFDKKLFLGWDIPAYHFVSAAAMKAIPEGKYYRRWRQCSHEYNYNSKNLIAIGEQVPGANTTLPNWNRADDAWTIPVWWDSNQE